MLHQPHILLKRQIYDPCVIHVFTMMLGSREEGGQLDAKRNTSPSKCRQTILPPQGQSLPEGKEPVCVLGEEMLMLALILKGPLKSITLSSLQRREINMFLKAKRAACGVCVCASLIRSERSCSLKRAIIFQDQVVSFPTLYGKILTRVRNISMESMHVCMKCLSLGSHYHSRLLASA